MPGPAIVPGAMSWLFLAVMLLLLPAAVVMQHQRLSDQLLAALDRRAIYLSAAVTHVFLLTGAWLVIRELDVPVLPMATPGAFELGVAITALAVGLLPVALSGWADARTRARAAQIAPRTAGEAAGFAGLALTAGVAEEIAYRCVLFLLLAHFLGSWWLAALAGGVAFGVVHLFQGWRSATLAAALGVVAQVTLGLTGNVLLIIAVHVLHDLIAGAVISKRARDASPGGQPLAV